MPHSFLFFYSLLLPRASFFFLFFSFFFFNFFLLFLLLLEERIFALSSLAGVLRDFKEVGPAGGRVIDEDAAWTEGLG